MHRRLLSSHATNHPLATITASAHDAGMPQPVREPTKTELQAIRAGLEHPIAFLEQLSEWVRQCGCSPPARKRRFYLHLSCINASRLYGLELSECFESATYRVGRGPIHEPDISFGCAKESTYESIEDPPCWSCRRIAGPVRCRAVARRQERTRTCADADSHERR